jgi:hypothetical protein
LLEHLPEDTKIGIIDNALRFYQPTLFGTMLRTFDNLTRVHGVSHHALYQLRPPIERAIKWYRSDATSVVFRLAASGLLRLAKTYTRPEQGNVVETLQLFSTMLLTPPDTASGEPAVNNRPRLAQLQKAWKPAEINAVCSWISLLESDEQNRADIIACIDRFLAAKDRATRNIIHEATV